MWLCVHACINMILCNKWDCVCVRHTSYTISPHKRFKRHNREYSDHIIRVKFRMLTTGLRLGWLPLINAEILFIIARIKFYKRNRLLHFHFFCEIHIRTKDAFRFWQMHSICTWNGVCTFTNILSLSLSFYWSFALFFLRNFLQRHFTSLVYGDKF